jgi:ornithine carbamoyltransferase
MLMRTKRDYLTLRGLSRQELDMLLDRSLRFKELRRRVRRDDVLAGKAVAMVFEKPSLRTRVSFEIAVQELGGIVSFLEEGQVQPGKREAFLDMARTLERYADGLVLRTFSHAIQERVAQAVQIPVINALSESSHPCQGLADLLTIKEALGALDGVKLAFLGDGNNVAKTLMEACCRYRIDFRLASPKAFFPDSEFLESLKPEMAGTMVLTESLEEALEGADIVYTDVWVSMGKEPEKELRRRIFLKYQLNLKTLRLAKPNAKVMHCLPAVRGEEITSEVLDSPFSIVFDQAENRLHTTKALLEFFVANRP